MAQHQPMGSGGVDVDIATGDPRKAKSFEERRQEDVAKVQQAAVEAANLIAEIQSSGTLAEVVSLFQERLMELAAADPQCKALTRIIMMWRLKLEPVAAIANLMARHSLGPQLRSFLREAPAAPEGTPAEK